MAKLKWKIQFKKYQKSYEGRKMVPGNERAKELVGGLSLFCLAVWYFTAEFLGIYSLLLTFAILGFGFVLIAFYISWLDFRTTR